MPLTRPHSPGFNRVALLAAFAATLQAGLAPAEALSSGLALETTLPWSGQAKSGFHLSSRPLFPPESAAPDSNRFRLDWRDAYGSPVPADGEDRWGLKPSPLPVPVTVPRPDHSGAIAGGFTALFLGLEYTAFWASAEVSSTFVFANEGWFGQTTYSGGADKASHLVGGYIAGRALSWGLSRGGSPPAKSEFLSAAMIALTGTLVEVGDAYHGFGFSWQDALITATGGVAGSLLAAARLDDTITMRFGRVGIDLPDDPSVVVADPNHYSGEVYTLDLRMAGLLPRLGKPPGIARFLLASATYGTKGYRGVDERYRQRRIGFEIGLDTYEVGLALGLKPDTWWGAPILGFLRYFRLPFTGIGFQYELDSGRWIGPNSFYTYDP